MRTFLVLLLLAVFLAPLYASPSADSSAVARAVESYCQRTAFSGTILVARAGEPVYHQSFGLAYRATPDTLTNDYHFSIASVTKLFTSIRILQLVEAGQIDLHQPLTQYLPEFQSHITAEVTPHQLLLHISGLAQEKDRMYRQLLTPRALVERSLRQNKAGTPGQFNYNNMDYLLLGLLIEARTGQSWQENISTHIIQPLGLTQTGFLAYGDYPPHFAYTYRKQGKRLRQDPLFYVENFFAAGSMYSTAADLLRFDQALYGEALLGAAGKRLLAQSYPQYNYTGYGVWNYHYPFVATRPRIMERRGGILGANVVLVRLTDDNYTIIILSNDDHFNPDSFGDEHNLREMLIRALY